MAIAIGTEIVGYPQAVPTWSSLVQVNAGRPVSWPWFLSRCTCLECVRGVSRMHVEYVPGDGSRKTRLDWNRAPSLGHFLGPVGPTVIIV